MNGKWALRGEVEEWGPPGDILSRPLPVESCREPLVVVRMQTCASASVTFHSRRCGKAVRNPFSRSHDLATLRQTPTWRTLTQASASVLENAHLGGPGSVLENAHTGLRLHPGDRSYRTLLLSWRTLTQADPSTAAENKPTSDASLFFIFCSEASQSSSRGLMQVYTVRNEQKDM